MNKSFINNQKYMKLLFIFLITSLTASANSSVNNVNILNKNSIDPLEVKLTQCSRSIDDLIQNSIISHPSMQAAQQTIEAASNSVDAANWNYYPSLSVDFGSSDNGLGRTVKLEQPLWAAGRIDATYDIAISKRDEAGFAFTESAYNLTSTLLDVIQDYLQFQDRVKILTESKKELEMFKSMIDRRIKAQISPETDRALIKSRMASNYNDLISAKVTMRTSLEKIKLITGKKDFSCDIESKNHNINNNLDNIISKMLATHPALKKMDAQIKGSIHSKKKEESALYPTISAVAEHQNGSVYNDSSSTNNVVYINAQMALDSGLSTISNIKAAQAETQRLKYEKISMVQELTTGLLSHLQSYNMANQQISGMQTALQTSQEVLDSYKRLFVAGKRQWLDLVNAVREVTNNKIDYSDAKVVKVISRYKILLQQGDIIDTRKEIR